MNTTTTNEEKRNAERKDAVAKYSNRPEYLTPAAKAILSREK